MTTPGVLDRLENVRGSGPWWTARCPAHDDRHASLSVGIGRRGTWVLYCHAGCTPADVARAAGLAPADLATGKTTFVEITNISRAEREQLRTYALACRERLALDPRGQHGLGYAHGRFGLERRVLAAIHVGYDPGSPDVDRPSFMYVHGPVLTVPLIVGGRLAGLQARRLTNATPRWISPRGSGWGRIGTFAIDRGGPVLVTEGPSDALAAVALGYAAVAIRGAALASTPQRARRALAPALQELRDRDVVTAGDGDDTGRHFNVGVRSALEGVARRIRVLEVPEGLDLAALAQRHGADAARATVEAAR
jgi:putative DNA primase/helicase